MNIFLVRHGDKEKIIVNPPLTDLGKIQAQKTAEYFGNIKIDKIYSSPLLRTKQTTEIISKYLKMDFEINNLLKERFCWGDIKDQTYSDFIEMWKKASLVRNWKPPKGLSSQEAGENLNNFLDSVDNTIYKNIIVVTHGGIISDFLRNIFSDKNLNEIYPDFSDYYENQIPVCSITTLEKNKGNYKIISIANTDHLKK